MNFITSKQIYIWKSLTQSIHTRAQRSQCFSGLNLETDNMIHDVNVILNETDSTSIQIPQSFSAGKLDMKKCTKPLCKIQWMNVVAEDDKCCTLPVSAISYIYCIKYINVWSQYSLWFHSQIRKSVQYWAKKMRFFHSIKTRNLLTT